jgi:hypothetical protein
MQQGDKFNSIDSACEAIKRYVLDNSELFKLKKSNKKRYSIVCKETACDFAIRASKSSKEVVSITVFKLHTCSPATYYNNQHAHSVSYLVKHYCALIINNYNISSA